MKTNLKSRLFAFVMALVMVCSLLPMSVFATEGEPAPTCSGLADCTLEPHKDDCLGAIAKAEAEAKAAAIQAEFDGMIAALPTVESAKAMNAEEKAAAYEKFMAVSDYADENGLTPSEEQGAFLVALNAALNEPVVATCSGTAECAAATHTATCAKAVAAIGDVGYTSLQNAVAGAAAGDTVTVIADIADETVTTAVDMTITGSTKLSNVVINQGSGTSLTVSNLTFEGVSSINAGKGAKALTVTGVTANVNPNNGSHNNTRASFIGLGNDQHADKSMALTVTNSSITISEKAATEGNAKLAIVGWAYLTSATITGNSFGTAALPYQYAAVKLMGNTADAKYTISNNVVYGESFSGEKFFMADLYQSGSRANVYTAVMEGNTLTVGGAGENYFARIQSSGGAGSARVNISSGNKMNGANVAATNLLIKESPCGNTTNGGYVGVDVATDSSGKVIAGTLSAYSAASIAGKCEVTENDDGTFTVAEEKLSVNVGAAGTEGADVNATVSEIVAKAEDLAATGGAADITLPPATAAGDGTNVPTTLVDAVAGSEANINIAVPVKVTADTTAEVVFNNKAVEAIATAAAATDEIKLTIAPVQTPTATNAAEYDVTLEAGGQNISAFGEGIAKLTLPVPSGMTKPVVYFLDAANNNNKQVFVKSTLSTDGKTITAETDHFSTWGVMSVADTNAVVEVEGVPYTTLKDAIEAAKDGETVKLLADVTIDSAIAVNANITIVGGNYTVTATYPTSKDATDGAINVATGKTLTIESGNFTTNSKGLIETNGTLNIKDGTFISTADAEVYDSRALIYVNEGGSVTMSGGKITTAAAVNQCGMYGIYAEKNTEVTISNGEFNTAFACVGLNNLTSSPAVVTITGGSFTTSNNCTGNNQKFNAVLYLPANADVAISGGTFTAASGGTVLSMPYANVAHDIDISGGTFNGTLNYFGNETAQQGTTGAKSINITGGTISDIGNANNYTGTVTKGANVEISTVPSGYGWVENNLVKVKTITWLKSDTGDEVLTTATVPADTNPYGYPLPEGKMPTKAAANGVSYEMIGWTDNKGWVTNVGPYDDITMTPKFAEVKKPTTNASGSAMDLTKAEVSGLGEEHYEMLLQGIDRAYEITVDISAVSTVDAKLTAKAEELKLKQMEVFDVTVSKAATGSALAPVTSTLTDLTIKIPFKVTANNKDSIKVLHLHDGAVSEVSGVTVGADYIQFKSKQFSPFAIAYNNVYNITYMSDGKELETTATEYKTYTQGVGITKLPEPSWTGYTFAGWYTNEKLTGTAVTEIPAKETGDKTFYAKWTGLEYKVTFDANGGKTPSTTEKMVTNGETYGKLPTTTKDGLYFAGWWTKAEGGTRIYETTKVNQNSNIILYAHWSTNPVTGDNVSMAQIAALGGALALSVAALVAIVVLKKRKDN